MFWQSFLIITTLLSVARAQLPNSPRQISDESAVYSAVIRAKYVDAGDKLIIVFGETVRGPCPSPSHETSYKNLLQPIARSTLEDYDAKSKQARGFANDLDVPLKYVLLPKKAFDEMFHTDNFSGWKTFYKTYPGAGGLVRLSQVGFNDEHTEALVYAEEGCGATCGKGEYLVLSKINSRWQLKRGLLCFAS